MLVFLRHFYPFVRVPLRKFSEMQCVFTLAFVSCLSSEDESLHRLSKRQQ